MDCFRRRLVLNQMNTVWWCFASIFANYTTTYNVGSEFIIGYITIYNSITLILFDDTTFIKWVLNNWWILDTARIAKLELTIRQIFHMKYAILLRVSNSRNTIYAKKTLCSVTWILQFLLNIRYLLKSILIFYGMEIDTFYLILYQIWFW